ncbi:MAG: hypothetical protein AAGU01_02185 [Clostridiaceae bacterium]
MFLQNKIGYLMIIDIIEECMNKFENENNIDLEVILDTENKVRRFIQNKYKF